MQYVCEECDKVFLVISELCDKLCLGKNNLKNHYKYIHRFSYEECVKTFFKTDMLKQQIKSMHGVTCEVCNDMFLNKSKQHTESLHMIDFNLYEQCALMFNSKQNHFKQQIEFTCRCFQYIPRREFKKQRKRKVDEIDPHIWRNRKRKKIISRKKNVEEIC